MNGFSYDTKIMRFEKIIADEKIAARSGFKVGDEIFDVRRLRYINGMPLILDKNYFLVSVVRELKDKKYIELEECNCLAIVSGRVLHDA